MDMKQSALETMVKEILLEKLSGMQNMNFSANQADGVIAVKVPKIKVDESNRLQTGHASDQVYTKDLFTLSESERLGCGIMEMKETTFDWTLTYDEIDYIIEGTLTININGKSVTAGPGEIILIPKGSKIQFSVKGFARFLYVTYPADWSAQN